MFEECRVEGAFSLTSGRSSSVFYDFDLLLPTETANYVQDLVKQVPDEILEQVEFVVSPSVGGIVPGYLAAFALRKPFVIVNKDGTKRGPEFLAGKYLIVDDVITSFQAANKVVAALPGMEPLGVAAYIFRGSRADLDAQSYGAFYLARKEQEV